MNLPENKFMPETILGIHSNVAGSDGFIDGHAWLTITRDGRTNYYGLWSDDHELVTGNGDANGDGSDVRSGYERTYVAVANRYYKLSAPQAIHFDHLMQANVHWRMTNNCSSWASEIVRAVIGEDVDADDNFGFETPRELGRSIQALEARDPTSFLKPKQVRNDPASSAMSSSSR